MNPGVESRGLQMGEFIGKPRFSRSHMSRLSPVAGYVIRKCSRSDLRVRGQRAALEPRS